MRTLWTILHINAQLEAHWATLCLCLQKSLLFHTLHINVTEQNAIQEVVSQLQEILKKQCNLEGESFVYDSEAFVIILFY